MSYTIDFKEVAQTSILDVATMLGITDLTEAQAKLGDETVTQFHGQCPISKSNNKTAFKITPKINRWICFCATCKSEGKKGGDCIELVCRVRGVDRMTAAKEIKGAGKTAGTPEPKQEVSSPSQPARFDPLAYLASLSTVHDDLTELGISPDTFNAFKAGYCGKGLHRGRLAFGLVDSQGEIRGFASAPLSGNGELLFPKSYVVPFFTGLQLVEEGELHLFDNVLHAMEAYENGERNILILLKPITADTLKCLYALMESKNCTTLEICY